MAYNFIFVRFNIASILVIKGNAIHGYKGLFIMLVGLTCLLAELYLYNRKYQ